MPKQVDHEHRRRQIADALWRVVVSRGFDGVSLRSVAAEAGVSMGLVQHYFRTKEQMLTFAMDSIGERVGERAAAELVGLPDPPPPRAHLRALLIQMIPLDEARRQEAHSLFAYFVGGVRDGVIGERMRSGVTLMRAFVAEQIAAGGVEPDPERATTILLALSDGLAAHVLGGYLSPADAVSALDAYLDHLFEQS